ncbi:hypothetical protein LINPERHAP2_LOCUS24482 [Linum perenne]
MAVNKLKKSLSSYSNTGLALVELPNNDPPAASTSTGNPKRMRIGKWFSFKEVSLEPGKSLKQQSSGKLKAEIKRWAKAVAAYARQVSGRLGTSMRSTRIRSSPHSSSSSSSSSPQSPLTPST